MKFKSKEKQEAYNNGGFRERYAMEHGNSSVIFINGYKCIKYTYSGLNDYQDANGATYNTITKQWIN